MEPNEIKIDIILRLTFFINISEDLDYSKDFWPVTDDEGLYQSYKESGAWYNHWHRNMPSPITILAGFVFNRDLSGIPDQETLDVTIPVQKPYWLEKPETFNTVPIRATWLGHATVLAEVDGTIGQMSH